MFTQSFNPYVSEGDNICCSVDGFDVVAHIVRDDVADAPDERDCGFWPSLDPNDPGYIGPKSRVTLRRHMVKARRVMEAWRNGEWWYVGVCLTVSKAGVRLVGPYDHALWGVECNYTGTDNGYLQEVANELLPEALAGAKAVLTRLCPPTD